MNRKSLTAVGVFVVLGLVALVALRQPEKGERATDRERPLAKISAAELDTLQITRGGATTVVKREAGKLTVTAPVNYPGDDTGGKAAFEAVEKLTLADLVTENKAKQAEFEVDDAKAIHVVAKAEKAGGKVLADFFVGKVVGAGTMVRLAGKDEIWQASGGLRGAFDREPADWRDRSITTFSTADAEMLTVKAKDGTVAIVKRVGAPNDDKWELVTSVPKLGPADKLDNSVPVGIISTLASWKANGFVDGAPPKDGGFDAPRFTITIALKGGKTVTVLIGNKKGEDDTYVKAGDAPQIFIVKKFNLDRLAKRPVEFKDKTVCDLAEGDLAEVAVVNGADSFTLSHAAGAWKATKPAGLVVDPSHTTSIGSGFKDWKGSGLSEESAATAGLAKPRATITAKSTKGVTCALKIGADAPDKQNTFAQTAKGPDVYLLPKWSVDRVLVKVADLKKK
jgi:hypothetical protein